MTVETVLLSVSEYERLRDLEEQFETLRLVMEEYANLDNWNRVRSDETGSAWERLNGHPVPWVAAQTALDSISNPASTTSGEDKQKDRNLGADSPEGALAAVGENPTVCRHCGLPGPTRCWCGQYDDPSGESNPATNPQPSGKATLTDYPDGESREIDVEFTPVPDPASGGVDKDGYAHYEPRWNLREIELWLDALGFLPTQKAPLLAALSSGSTPAKERP